MWRTPDICPAPFPPGSPAAVPGSSRSFPRDGAGSYMWTDGIRRRPSPVCAELHNIGASSSSGSGRITPHRYSAAAPPSRHPRACRTIRTAPAGNPRTSPPYPDRSPAISHFLQTIHRVPAALPYRGPPCSRNAPSAPKSRGYRDGGGIPAASALRRTRSHCSRCCESSGSATFYSRTGIQKTARLSSR